MIELTGVTKAYGSSVVVDGVSLQLAPGGITSIVGSNGAGKSTLLSLIARLLSADAGTIRVGDFDVAACDSRALAKVLAILKQDNHMATRLSVRDLVSFGRFPHTQGRLGPRDHELVASAIDYMDLGELSERFLDEMSGGQRQRAFVAMVLAQDTDYVLLDEPLNNLDMSHSQAMMSRLRLAATELGKTVVLVVHDINFASCWSDQIIAMKDGRVIATGRPDEIVTTERLREIFDIDTPVIQVDGHRIAHFYLPVDRSRSTLTA